MRGNKILVLKYADKLSCISAYFLEKFGRQKGGDFLHRQDNRLPKIEIEHIISFELGLLSALCGHLFSPAKLLFKDLLLER